MQERSSFKSLCAIGATLAIVASLWAPRLSAAKPGGPVEITTSRPPAGMRTGDIAEITIRVRTMADLQRLEITVYVVEGLQLLSDPTPTVYENVKAEEVKNFTARVRLTDPKEGLLAIMAESVGLGGTRANDLKIGRASCRERV